ncbi:NPCBM/NEW2 domain-containing protein [Arcticibacter tournemirensis]|uniref:Glycosyl hydrolase family 98 putative carbohydrate-binding module domain-containing protein n=1 Tax=Arcticibacter tournemirensis TaxID=699437 RepID=A0A5M9HDF2_9SPHI|nr:NPCBM/NEW2 domain-containing protein [Arcticibacter tournemirensis]KAA8482927.1 hypothetical protein F1649_10610 [Arcticibacter tournemirensis]TQM49688.1 NPCBM/NEW2 domain-containing protein [Arcticibacter tournemirensis]
MKFLRLLSLSIVLYINSYSQSAQTAQSVISDAKKAVETYNKDMPKANNVVKVVYFHGKGHKLSAGWEERLTRILTAVSDYYRDEFGRYGIKSDGVNFDKSGNKYVITVVEGDFDSKSYNVNSSAQLQTEISNKTRGKIDFSDDHILVITGLYYMKDKETYVFNSPYMGTGSSVRGVSFAADCPLLDPKLLTDKVNAIKFSEPNKADRECSVAEFNSWYIGGIAHEMGHMFGLFHDFGNPFELTASSISLMGEYGSRHFKGDAWGDTQTSYISGAGILQLLSHPVFTGYSKYKKSDVELSLNDIHCSIAGDSIFLKADLASNLPPYALSVLISPLNRTEYFNESAVYSIPGTGPISVPLKKWNEGNYRMYLIFMLPNGVVYPFFKLFAVGQNSAEIKELPGRKIVDVKELYSRVSAMEKTPEIKKKLRILESIINPSPFADPITYGGDSLYLSDAKWEVANVGWEKPARNYFTIESENVFFLVNRGEIFEKGLFAHSPSIYSFRLDKKWTRFSAIIGLRDYAHQQGSARFTLIGDGKVLYQSPIMRVGQQSRVEISIKNISKLELKAEGTEGHNYNSWAIWASPLISR